MRSALWFRFFSITSISFMIVACGPDSRRGGGSATGEEEGTASGEGEGEPEGSGEPGEGEGEGVTGEGEGDPAGEGEGEGSCVAACAGRVCGDDGCGSVCGECQADQRCAADGQCIPQCVPTCDPLRCGGDDGCGQRCGCTEPLVCIDEFCAAPSCDRAGFARAVSKTTLETLDRPSPLFIHRAFDAPGDAANMLLLESYQGAPYNGPTGPGTYTLTGENFADCGLCLRVFSSCGIYGCRRVYLARSGVVDIQAMGGLGTPFAATLRNIELEEVTIDPENAQSSPVIGGKVWCIDGYRADEPIVEDQPEPTCVRRGSGTSVNDNIADFRLQNGNGTMINLHKHCGATKAVWIIAVAGWCSACADYLPLVRQQVREYRAAGKSLEVWLVLGEDQSGNAPTLDFCNAYAEHYGYDPGTVFIDPGWATLFANVNPYIRNDTILLPWEALLDGDNLAYIWHSPPTGDRLPPEVLEALLDD